MSDCHCTKYVGKPACIHDLRLMVDEQADTIDQQAETIARVREIVDNYSEPDRHSGCVAGLLTHLHLALRDVSENADTATNDGEHRHNGEPALRDYSWPALRDAIQRVRGLHKPETGTNHQYGGNKWCACCGEPYPCLTIWALDGGKP